MVNRHSLGIAAALTFLALVPLDSWAVCAAGVYRAGCAGPNGAAVVAKPVPAPYHPATVTCAKGVYRAGCAGPHGAAVVRR